MPIPDRTEFLQALEARTGRERLDRFQAATVAVCGLGGLGSHVAPALARAGVGQLILIDFDRVDLTNLHRQQYKARQVGRYKAEALAENLQEIAPYTRLVPHAARLTEANLEALLGPADVICECFDRAEEKALLANAALERFPDKFLVAASGMAGLGPGNAIQTRKVAGRFYLCGDGVSDSATSGGLYAPRVMLCAAHQALTVLRLLDGQLSVS